MHRIEVSHWTAGETADLALPESWLVERRSPDFPDAVLEAIAPVLAEPCVRTSAMDVAPEMVVGLYRGHDAITAFCCQATSYARVALWLASTRAVKMKSHDFVRSWSIAVTSERVEDFRWTMPIDLSVLQRLLPRDHAARYPRMADAGKSNVAIRDDDHRRRLDACCDLASRLRGPLILVDNLTVVDGTRIRIAGLVPSYRRIAFEWTIVDLTDPPFLEETSVRLRERITNFIRWRNVARASSSARTDGEFEPTSPPVLSNESPLPAQRSDVDKPPANAATRDDIVASIRAAIANEGRGSEVHGEIFRSPDRLGDSVRQAAIFAGMSVPAFEALVRALVLARSPGGVGEETVLTEWYEAVKGLDTPFHALILAEVAQTIYDHYLAQSDEDARGFARDRIDELIDTLAEKIDRMAANDAGPGEDGAPDRQSDGERALLIEAVDRLAELETGTSVRDARMLRAQAVARLHVGAVTPDVAIRAVHGALADGDGALTALIAASDWHGALEEIAAVAVSDARNCSREEGRRTFRDMIRKCPPADPAASAGAGQAPIFVSF